MGKSKARKEAIEEADKRQKQKNITGRDPVTGRKLTIKQDRFARGIAEAELITGKSQAAVAREAGYPPSSAGARASENVAKRNVAEAIEVYKGEQLDKARGAGGFLDRLDGLHSKAMKILEDAVEKGGLNLPDAAALLKLLTETRSAEVKLEGLRPTEPIHRSDLVACQLLKMDGFRVGLAYALSRPREVTQARLRGLRGERAQMRQAVKDERREAVR